MLDFVSDAIDAKCTVIALEPLYIAGQVLSVNLPFHFRYPAVPHPIRGTEIAHTRSYYRTVNVIPFRSAFAFHVYFQGKP